MDASLHFLCFSLLFALVLPFPATPVAVSGAQPMNPGDYHGTTTVPAFPVESQTAVCHLDLSDEFFGGVKEACSTLDRSRCCPVLAAWLFAAHARFALQSQPPSSYPTSSSGELPAIPDDSQKCANSLQSSLEERNIVLPQPNATCDTMMCFCGIRLHQISSLSCPAAFNVSVNRNATPTAVVKNLSRECRNSSYLGCTRCLTALQKLKNGENYTREVTDRASKMFNRDCQLMGLTWLLAQNKTAFIPTVSAVLRAVMYSAAAAHRLPSSHDLAKCSPDQENMPLAVDSLQFLHQGKSSSVHHLNALSLLPVVLTSGLIFLLLILPC